MCRAVRRLLYTRLRQQLFKPFRMQRRRCKRRTQFMSASRYKPALQRRRACNPRQQSVERHHE